jgi:hypothetical protein
MLKTDLTKQEDGRVTYYLVCITLKGDVSYCR